MANPITLFDDRTPNYYPIQMIYDPDLHGPDHTGRVIPQVDALVKDENGQLLYVTHVDEITKKVTYAKTRLLVTSETEASLISIVSYGNDIFRVYYDDRVSPIRLNPDARLLVYGSNIKEYRLVINRGGPTEEVISKFYDTDGDFSSDRVPMAMVDTEAQTRSWYGTPCHTTTPIMDNDTVYMEIFNSYGALVAVVTLHAQRSVILNEAVGYRPVITGMRIESTQKRSNGEIFIYEKQDIDSLMLEAIISYSDGREVRAEIDNQKCFMYGAEDFVASWAGLRHPLTVKYYLARDEVTDPVLNADGHITAAADLVVVANELAASIKISAIPQWTPALGRYMLRYFCYSTDRDRVRDVTPYVTIDSGSYVGNLYGTAQSFTIALDMSQVDPVNYPDPAVHRQVVTVRLQPIAALERYTLRDGPSSPTVYGIDTTTSRRPVLNYDTSREQYYIPSSLFRNEAGFLKSFYLNATPPYLMGSETGPVTPTHFIIRDVNSGSSLTSTPIPIEQYAVAFNIIGSGPVGRYVDGVVLFEFIHQVDIDTSLILYGAPVDVYQGAGYVG